VKRRLEPELMDETQQALAYAQADFSEPNELFLKLLAEMRPGDLAGQKALDLGCGPADIVVRFLKAYPQAHCDALDGSAAMLAHARELLDGLPGIASRCRLLQDVLPSERLPKAGYDLILSNSLLHHLHDPQVLWRTVRESARSGALVLVMDLMRPPSAVWAESLVASYAGDAPEVLKRDFRNSLFAAFEPREVTAQLEEAGLEALEVRVVSDRHLAIAGRLM
jgi:SAM-dependent methyltransferase